MNSFSIVPLFMFALVIVASGPSDIRATLLFVRFNLTNIVRHCTTLYDIVQRVIIEREANIELGDQ